MRLITSVSLVAALAFTGCKKKEGENASAKPTEGSSAPSQEVAPTPGAEPAKVDPAAAPAAPDAAKDLLETAKANGSFTTFLKAIDAAGLASTFSGAGPFTVFAPTDEAFAKLPPPELEALLADKAKLEALLQLHVIPGAVASQDLGAQQSVKSVQGGELALDSASGLSVNGAKVTTPDVVASNGVIHAIDTVLVPR